jgi:hypothetical protein
MTTLPPIDSSIGGKVSVPGRLTEGVGGIRHRTAAAPAIGSLQAERAELGAARFEIVVKGRLSPTLTTAIEGFDVSHCERGETHLVGWVADQARLHGTIELLRDLNIELVSVNPVRSQTTGERERQAQ